MNGKSQRRIAAAPWILQAPAQIRDARIEISYSFTNFWISSSVADCEGKGTQYRRCEFAQYFAYQVNANRSLIERGRNVSKIAP